MRSNRTIAVATLLSPRSQIAPALLLGVYCPGVTVTPDSWAQWHLVDENQIEVIFDAKFVVDVLVRRRQIETAQEKPDWDGFA
jgi:hypothetical protein